MNCTNDQKLVIGLIAIIVIVVIINIFLLLGPAQSVTPEPPPITPPPVGEQTELIAIVSNNCVDCVDLGVLVQQIRSLGIDFSERTIIFETDTKAQQLVEQYSIDKLPGLVIKANQADFETLGPQWASIGSSENDNTLVLRQVPLPYYDIATQITKGMVELWSIAKTDCEDCSPAVGIQEMQSLGITISQEHLLQDTDAEAVALIEQYEITKLPALILSSEIRDYEQLIQVLSVGGEFLENGTWILRFPAPYYWDLNENRMAGAITLTRLDYAECTDCFDVQELEAFIVQSFGLQISNDVNVDWGTEAGKELALEYTISQVPTIILSGELSAYNGLEENWNAFGFVTDSGELVFDKHNQLGSQYPYFDIDSNSMIIPEDIVPLG